jgi:hypothetical protein
MPDQLLDSLNHALSIKLKDAGLTHLKTALRGKNISIYSEFEGSRENRCRFSQISGLDFALGMADHNGKWEYTPFEGTIDELLEMVMTQFNWVLSDYSID